MTDVTGTTNWFGYDSNGNPTEIFRPQGQLFYTYDAAGNLTRLSGQNTVNYTYDALNRLSTVATTVGGVTTTQATYGYDNVGNLASVTYANGVVHNYTYDNRNRLTNLGVNKAATAVASYAYTLDAAGHRTSVTERSGRTVSYSYDSIYRLTNETIAADPNNVNGAASYVYDNVGNRTQKTSTIPGFPGGLTNYNANDQISTDTYDSNGNTTASNGLGYVYDFENHVIQAGAGITMVYDGDGNRVKKTVAGVTTTYLVDTQNPTGYAQVASESITGNTTQPYDTARVYVYGLERISQQRSYVANNQGQTQTSYYVYDGHGSTRALTDPTGAVTDTYDYDAFGNLLHSAATGIPPGGTTVSATPNEFLFAGEQFDSDLGLYYNRARYLNVSTGRFWTMDSFEGDAAAPTSLHKYLFTANDPIDQRDPTGKQFGLDATIAGAIGNILNAMEANVGNAIIQGIQCEQEGTCKNGTVGALFDLAFTALASTVIIGAISVVGKVVKQLPLRFSQITAAVRFQEETGFVFQGETIGAVAAKLRTGAASPAAVPVRFIVRGSARLIVDTRSALALLRAGIEESRWVLVDVTESAEEAAAMTARLAKNGLTEEGTDVIRITGLGSNVSNLQ